MFSWGGKSDKPRLILNYHIMKKTFLLLTGLILLSGFYSVAQDSEKPGKALCFPTKKYGICIGNSTEFTGIRINFADKHVKVINGINLTFWLKKFQNMDAVVNGISLGVMPAAGTMQALNIGILGVGVSQDLNGLTVSGLIIGSGGAMHGVSATGIYSEIGSMAGVSLTGLFGVTQVLNGIGIGGLLFWAEQKANGVAVSAGAVIDKGVFNGLALAGYVDAKKMNGLSIALVNRSEELHGVQIGLLNYAGNNPKGLKWLPFINLHLM